MKKVFLACLFAPLALAACNTGTTNNTDVASNGTAAVVAPVIDKACEVTTTAMYAAEAAYNAPASAYVSADAKGLLSAEVKGKVKPLMLDAYAWLGKARTAYAVRDALGFCTAADSVSKAAASAKALLPAS